MLQIKVIACQKMHSQKSNKDYFMVGFAYDDGQLGSIYSATERKVGDILQCATTQRVVGNAVIPSFRIAD